MKRYFIVNEFFGSRLYDTVEKTEEYLNDFETEKIKRELKEQYIEINNSKTKKMSAPLKISMNITKRCNLRCKQCFSDSGEIQAEELTTSEICKLFDDMRNNGTFFICIGGGEPFTRPDILELLEYGNKKQLAISVVSNGLLITKDLINELNKRNLDTIWISLDGMKENHERLRGKGTFDRTLESIKILKDNINCKLAIRISLSKDNISEYRELIKLAEELSVDIIRLTPILAFGRAKNEDLTISQEQYIKFLNEIKNIKSSIKIIHPGVTNSSKFWIDSSDFGCHCGKEAIWIDELGNYSPCIFFGDAYNAGNIKDDSYINLWKKCINIVNYSGNPVCKNCSNYKNCRGGCRARVLDQTGNWEGVDPLCPLRKNMKINSDIDNYINV